MKKIYIVALIFAIATGLAVYIFAGSLKQAAAPEPIPTSSVVVASVDIPEGVFITMEMLQITSVPTEFALPGAITTIGDAVGKVNKYKCLANSQIVAQQLGSAEDAVITEGGRLSYTLDEGMRAMTVYTSEISGVAGYINPGDRVDVVCTINISEPAADGETKTTPTSTMLMENVNVLETGLITANLADEAAGTKTLYTSITLAVSSEDAVKLQYAVSFGQLTFLLRPTEDAEIVAPKDYTGVGK